MFSLLYEFIFCTLSQDALLQEKFNISNIQNRSFEESDGNFSLIRSISVLFTLGFSASLFSVFPIFLIFPLLFDAIVQNDNESYSAVKLCNNFCVQEMI
mmetsp:Transcript_26970/g.40951  ORF Transcript_26970/g.40951 Transcript_26970/m.40951 type:complete len:99 (-) Transcript_26970:617-913(-)